MRPDAVLHYLRHQGGIFGADVLIVEMQQLAEAQHLVVEIDPGVHLAQLHVANDVIHGCQPSGLCFQLQRLVGRGKWSP
jgi:hypothetical protein